jgi:hemoglobin
MAIRSLKVFLLAAVITIPLAAQSQSPPMGPSPKAQIRDGKTLYQRLGGYDAIAKTVDAFLPHLLAADPKIPNMISGLSQASRMRNRQMIVDQICMLTGGPCLFVGRPNDVTHQGLEITQEMWDKSQKALADTLDELKVKEPERSELLAVIDDLKGDIIQKPKPPGAGRSGRSGQ